MTQHNVSFERAGGPEDGVSHTHQTRLSTSSTISTAEDEVVITEDSTEIHTQEAPESTSGMSTVSLPRTIQQRVRDIAGTMSREQDATSSITRINEWWSAMEEEEVMAMDVVQSQEEFNDACPTAVLAAAGNGGVYALHSVATARLTNRSIPAHGKTYGFVGDVALTEDEEWTLPTLAELHPVNLYPMIHDLQTATVKACEATSNEPNEEALLAPGSTKRVSMPQVFPLPLSWIPYFLENRSQRETYRYLSRRTKEWSKTDDGKLAATRTMTFARALLTRDTDDDSNKACIIYVSDEIVTPVAPSGQLLDWASRRVWTVVQPRAGATTVHATTPPDQRATTSPDGRPNDTLLETMVTCMTGLVAVQKQQAAKDELAAERAAEKDREAKNKPIPDVLLAPLLGYSGLSWDQRDELHPIFTKLNSAKTRPEKIAHLKELFNGLAKEEASFTGFANMRLFTDIINMKFAPGLTAATAGQGIGLLAFTALGVHDIRAEEEEADAFDAANVITPADSRKNKASKVVQPPTTLSDLLLLGKRYVTFCNALFSDESSWADAVESLFARLEENQNTLRNMDSADMRRLVLEVVWAVTSEANKFFDKPMTKEKLQRERPRFARTGLRDHIGSFENGISRELGGFPSEWRPRPSLPPLPATPLVPPPGGGGGGRRSREDEPGSRGGAGRRATQRRDDDENDDFVPQIFRNSRELQDVKSRIRFLSLTKLCQATSIRNTTELMQQAGVPEIKCLSKNVLGKCTYAGCQRNHLVPISTEQAQKVYQLILPGIRALLPQPAGR